MVRNNSKIINIASNQAKNDNELNHAQSLSYWHYLKVCFVDKLFCYHGRARRKEYLAFQLVDFTVAAMFFAFINYLGMNSQTMIVVRDFISTLFIIPLLSVSVRRFHDTGLSGWWCFLAVVPFVVLAYLLLKDSDRAENKYGAVPEGKTFGTPWYAYLMKQKNVPVNNVIAFESEKAVHKSTERAA